MANQVARSTMTELHFGLEQPQHIVSAYQPEQMYHMHHPEQTRQPKQVYQPEQTQQPVQKRQRKQTLQTGFCGTAEGVIPTCQERF
jgi:hypothetical protein